LVNLSLFSGETLTILFIFVKYLFGDKIGLLKQESGRVKIFPKHFKLFTPPLQVFIPHKIIHPPIKQLPIQQFINSIMQDSGCKQKGIPHIEHHSCQTGDRAFGVEGNVGAESVADPLDCALEVGEEVGEVLAAAVVEGEQVGGKRAATCDCDDEGAFLEEFFELDF
jgi:hypothetical protein